MMSKGKEIVGAIGTISGRLADLFLHGKPMYAGGAGPWAADLEIVDSIGETERQLPLDYIKMLNDNEIVPHSGLTKGAFIETLPKWARPAFENTAYVGFVGPLHQEQIIKLQSEHLQASKPQEPNYAVAEIDFIVGDMMGYTAPDAPDELGPNFTPWVKANEKTLKGMKGWEGILKQYA